MSWLPTMSELLIPWKTANFVLLVSLSLIVIYQAYRGYRRHGGRPLLFLALGVAFLTIVPTLITLLATLLLTKTEIVLVVSPATETLRVIGLFSIIYSMYGRR